MHGTVSSPPPPRCSGPTGVNGDGVPAAGDHPPGHPGASWSVPGEGGGWGWVGGGGRGGTRAEGREPWCHQMIGGGGGDRYRGKDCGNAWKNREPQGRSNHARDGWLPDDREVTRNHALGCREGNRGAPEGESRTHGRGRRGDSRPSPPPAAARRGVPGAISPVVFGGVWEGAVITAICSVRAARPLGRGERAAMDAPNRGIFRETRTTVQHSTKEARWCF